MAKSNYAGKRRKAAAALRSLAAILNRRGICPDVSPLSRAAEQCGSEIAHGAHSWGYDIAHLVFRMDPPKGTLPQRAKDFRVELSISLVSRFDTHPEDQFTSLEINLEKYAQSAEGAQLKSAWHFDRHLIDTVKDHPHLTDDIHPLYHFQYGGARMTKLMLGETLLLEPPRLMHPPMDGILAVDFVLANYAGRIWKSLREDSQYQNLIAPQFEQIWRPYFLAVADSWKNPRSRNSGFLCPFV